MADIPTIPTTGDGFLTTGEREFLDKLLAHRKDGDEERFHCWVRKSKHGKIQERLVFVSKYRLWSVKKGSFGKKTVQREGHLLELRSIKLSRKEHARLSWDGWYVEFQTGLVPQLVCALRAALAEISVGYCADLQPALEIEGDSVGTLLEVPAPDSSPAVAFERNYRALCNLHGVVAHQPLIDAIHALVAEGNHTLDLNALPFVSARSKPPFDLRTAFRALRFDRHFEAVLLRDQPWKETVACIAEVMRYNTTICKLALTNLDTHEGFAALGEALQVNNQHRLSELELSLNKVGNDMLTLAPALQASPLGLRRLLLNSCEVNAKTGVLLFAGLKESTRTSAVIEELGVSHNDLGPIASASLSAWLGSMAGVSHLQRLLLNGSVIDVAQVCESASVGLAASLQELDLTGNRVDVRAAQAVGQLIKASQSLRLLSLGACRMRVDAFAALLTSAGECNFPHLDLSRNELAHGGSKHVAELSRLVASNRSLYSLDVSHNHLKNDYLAKFITDGVCASSSLRRINLSCNGSKGSKWKLLLTALQSLLSSSTLDALSIAGDGSKFMYGEKLSAIFPLLESTKLSYLDLSANRLGERPFISLCDSFRRNQSLQEIQVDGNAAGMPGVCALRDCILEASSRLCHVHKPTEDIQRVLSACKGKEREPMRVKLEDMWSEVEAKLHRNRENTPSYTENMFLTKILCASDPAVDLESAFSALGDDGVPAAALASSSGSGASPISPRVHAATSSVPSLAPRQSTSGGSSSSYSPQLQHRSATAAPARMAPPPLSPRVPSQPSLPAYARAHPSSPSPQYHEPYPAGEDADEEEEEELPPVPLREEEFSDYYRAAPPPPPPCDY